VLGYAYWKFCVAFLLVVWLRMRNAQLSDYGFRNFGPVWLFLVVTVAAIAVGIVVPSVLQPVLTAHFQGGRDLSRFAPLVGNQSMLMWVLPAVWLFAAVGEEVFYRGFVLESLRRILGSGRTAMILAIVGQGLLFGAVHYYQGPAGMIPVGIGGVISGFLYWAGGRRLWPLILAHGVIDTVGLLAIYSGQMPV